MHQELVTVGVPFYNDKRIFSCLDNLLLQTYTNLQIIISDNFSENELSEKVQIYCKEKKLEYFRNDKNYGAIYNHNNLLAYAKGDYFLWLHPDDKISNNFIEKSVEILNADKDIVSVIGNIIVLYKIDNNKVIRKYAEPKKLYCNKFERIKNFIKGNYPDTFLNHLHRKSKLKNLGDHISSEIPFIFNLLDKGKIYGCKDISFFKNENQDKRNFKNLSKHYNPYKKLNKHLWFKECIIILIKLEISLIKKVFLIVSFFLYNLPILRNFIKKK